MRGVGCVQRLCPELEIHSLTKPELPEKTRIEVGGPRSVERIETRRPEPNSRHGRESSHVEISRRTADSAKGCHVRLHLIRLLVCAGARIQRSRARSDGERQAVPDVQE